MTDRMVLALVAEREAFLASGRSDRVIPVDEQLANRGYCVTAEGELVKLDEDGTARRRAARQEAAQEAAPERAEAPEPAETAVEPRPKKRGGRPRLPRDEDGNIIRSSGDEDES